MGAECIGMISTSKVVDPEFVTMEDLGFVWPFFQGIWWSGHGEVHGGDSLVKTSGEVGASH